MVAASHDPGEAQDGVGGRAHDNNLDLKHMQMRKYKYRQYIWRGPVWGGGTHDIENKF